jgi:hypothetical protein
MANYCAFTRTNYFAVTDEYKFREHIRACQASDDEIQVYEASNGSGKFAFGCYGSLSGFLDDDCDEPDLDTFYDALQDVLSDGDAIIITELGYENLRYLIGVCTVITKSEIRFLNLSDHAVSLARTMLNDSAFTTQMDE